MTGAAFMKFGLAPTTCMMCMARLTSFVWEPARRHRVSKPSRYILASIQRHSQGFPNREFAEVISSASRSRLASLQELLNKLRWKHDLLEII
jgi:hypothetical protein